MAVPSVTRIDWHPHRHLPAHEGVICGVVVARCVRTLADDRPYRAHLLDGSLAGRADSAEDAMLWLDVEYRRRTLGHALGVHAPKVRAQVRHD